MGYYNAKPGMTVKDFVHSWQKGDKAYDDSMPIMMDIEELWLYRDYDRTRDTTSLGFSWPYYSDEGDQERANKNLLRGPEKWDKMALSLKKYGWDDREPLHLNVGKDGKAKVGEGNHRLAIWREMGKKQAPVVVHFVTAVYKTTDLALSPKVVESFKFKNWFERIR